MMQLQVLVLAHDERSVLEGLGQSGAVQLTSVHPGSDTAPLATTDHSKEIAHHDRIRSRIQELRQLLEIPPATRNIQRGERLTANQVADTVQSLEQQSQEVLGRRQRLIQHQKELAAVCERVSCFRGFEIPLDGLDQCTFLHFVAGRLPVQNFEGLNEDVGDTAILIPLAEEKGQKVLLSITTSRAWSDLERKLQGAGFQPETLPVAEGTTVDQLSEEAENEQEQIAEELEEVNGKLKAMAADFAIPLAEIERFIDTECRLLDASQKFARTEAAVLITGWIPAGDIASTEHRLGEITRGRYSLQATLPDPSRVEQVPVLMMHSRLLRPFEMLVSAYGFPNYQELEPTLFVALSYIVMFGMMFGDAGHGMVLAACGLIAFFSGKTGRTKDLGVLLLFGGLSSIIFGVVYGSYFGIELFKKYALWHDPLEGDPMQLMYGAISIGITMISLGIVLNVINRMRRGDVIGGILDKFGLVGLLFYWGTLVLLIHGSAIRSWGLMTVSVIVFLVLPLVGWSLKEPIEYIMRHRRESKDEAGDGLAGAIMESCVGAFEAILSYLANTISFVRLAAYAMSHAALLVAAFMLATAVREFPFGGSVWSILVVVLGNLIAIVLEGIIASVQALRLEYYEFFGKFFSGSGQPFEPFRLAPDGKDQEGTNQPILGREGEAR
jgi:V/A-type H+-transporting ATPase subunit I